MNRREFLFGATGAALVPSAVSKTAQAALPPLPKGRRPNLVVGVLSDIHVTRDDNANFFEKALRFYDSRKADAVLIAGDLTTTSRRSEFESVARTWRKVFPDDRRSDGVRIEKLFVTGNHDEDAFAGSWFKTFDESKAEAFHWRKQEVWQSCFDEDYKPIRAKSVKGYTFILRNWMSILGDEQGHKYAKGFGNERTPLPEFLPTLDLPKDRPFFYVQHEYVEDTTYATWLLRGEKWIKSFDRGLTRKALNGYPNCLALTGHEHQSLTDEKCVWQGEFTSVGCSCARGHEFTVPGRENGFNCADFNRKPPQEMPKVDVHSVRQGMLMSVYGDRIVFERREWTHDQSLGPDWVVPLYGGRTVPPQGVATFDFRRRAEAAKAAPPQFAPGAKVTAVRVKDGRRRAKDGYSDDKTPREQVVVSFPPVTTLAGSPVRAYDFGVRCEVRDADTVRTAAESRVFPPDGMQAESRETGLCTCAFFGDVIPRNRSVRFVVTPADCWGNEGHSVASGWMKLA